MRFSWRDSILFLYTVLIWGIAEKRRIYSVNGMRLIDKERKFLTAALPMFNPTDKAQ
jgi:hypothetical protein